MMGVPQPKPIVNRNNGLVKFIRKLPCAICGAFEEWNSLKGEGRSECSHVLTKGAMHGDVDNVFPACHMDHTGYEPLSTDEKEKWKPIGKWYSDLFFGVTAMGPRPPIPRTPWREKGRLRNV